MDGRISWGQTIGAAIVSVIVFFFLLYIAAPIVESLMNFHGRLFVPERYGGGSQVDNPGILNLALRAIMASGLSAVGAFAAALKLFSSAHKRALAILFGFVIVAWAGLFVLAGILSGAVLMPLAMVGLGAVPPLVVAYWAWKDEI